MFWQHIAILGLCHKTADITELDPVQMQGLKPIWAAPA